MLPIASFVCVSMLSVVAAQTDGGEGALCSKQSAAKDIAAGVDLQGQVAIVTGGDSGLGYAAAEALAQQGAVVVIASHNLEKCQVAAHNISASTGARSVGMALDLGSFASVRTFAAQFLDTFQTLNYLLNNAGIGGGNGKTKDGFEVAFEVNYLGHFLLTELLLPLLRATASRQLPARIINTASSAHFIACKSVGAAEDCLKDWTYLPTPVFHAPIVVNGTKINASTYGISKFAQIQHAAELAARESAHGVEAFSVCPGLVRTGMTSAAMKNFTEWCEKLPDFGIVGQEPCPYSAQEGAAVIAACALRAANVGRWYTRYTQCSDAKPVMEHGFTLAMRAEFYRRSRHWVGLETSANDILVA